MADNLQIVDPGPTPSSPIHIDMEADKSPVNPCMEAWTNASCYHATTEDETSDSDRDSEGTTSESGGNLSSSLESDSSNNEGLEIGDVMNEEFEQQLSNLGAYSKSHYVLWLTDAYLQLKNSWMMNSHT
jgi:hypothetical protein